jgi:predicted acyl esterase
MRRTLRLALWVALLGFSVAALAQERDALKLPVKTTYMVPMRDGTKLATDVYLPPGAGPWPAIALRTPYDKNKARGAAAGTLGGFAVVVQDIRGRFASEGKGMAFINDGWGEKQDGYDTIEWVAKQPWCNGKVGTNGASYLGCVQNAVVCTRPPHLVCSYASVAASNLYAQAGYVGGAFTQSLVEKWLEGNKWDPDNLKLMREHSCFDDYWKKINCEAMYHVAVTPMVQRGGWYDIFSQGTINSFVILQRDGGRGANGNQKLVMGPWTHGGWRRGSKQGELQYPANSNIPEAFSETRWYAYWLKGVDNGIMKDPAVTYYVMGDTSDPKAPGNEWRTANAWPPPSKETPYYLRADGRLMPEPPAADEKPQPYTYDPKNPVPTRGGNNLNIPAGPMDQRPVEDRPDVLLFTTPVLEQPVEVTGRVKVVLWASSSAKDTDFTAKLTDVHPDGRSMLVLDGIIRARHRDSMEREAFMEPGKTYKFEIDLWSTSIIFNKGHKIRVAVSSSNSPRFDANPNTGGQSWSEPNPVAAKNTIYHDAERPSHIVLPVRQ